jgi:predicted transcriptional regulator of viral defense system
MWQSPSQAILKNQMEQKENVETRQMGNGKLWKALPQILEDISRHQRKIFTRSQIEQLLSENIETWGLNKKTSAKNFLEFLNSQGKLREAVFDFPSRKETRYIWGEVTHFELAGSLKPNSYLTHRGAMYIHGLIDTFPETIYLNVEQPKDHERNSILDQSGIERAFSNKQRVSNEIAIYDGIQVCIVHGQKTGGLGVIDMLWKSESQLRVTSLERTLIDITVRPIYAGGAIEVLNAYRRAKDNLSIEKLIKVLKKMNYVYPYHQAIGFYLDRSGKWSKSKLQKLRDIPMTFDFYLEHKMAHPKYSEDWRIYYPKELI